MPREKKLLVLPTNLAGVTATPPGHIGHGLGRLSPRWNEDPPAPGTYTSCGICRITAVAMMLSGANGIWLPWPSRQLCCVSFASTTTWWI